MPYDTAPADGFVVFDRVASRVRATTHGEILFDGKPIHKIHEFWADNRDDIVATFQAWLAQ